MLHKITSPANPLIKTLKGLHAKKGRAETGLFLAEGARLALEAADLGVWPAIALVAPAALDRPPVRAFLAEAADRGARCVETSPAILEQVSKRDNAQTLVCAYPQRLSELGDLPADGFVIALDRVRDPGNLGTILRTADASGAGGVILVGECCDPFSVEAVRASMGAIFAVRLARAELGAFLGWRREAGLQLIGTSLNGRFGPEAYDAARPTAIFMGNEQAGLTPEMEAACDALIRLPMRGKADSLNLAVATAVTVYDLWRRRGYEGAHG
jgi:TrmH family RNA methyltransferase